MKIIQYYKNVYMARYILIGLVRQDLRNKYRRSMLGMAWSLVTPLGMAVIIGSVYSILLGQHISRFILFMFSGLLPWIFFATSAQGGLHAFISAEGYIKQTQTPIGIFPIRVTLGAFVHLVYALAAFYLVTLLVSPDKFNFRMLLVFPALCIWLIFSMAITNLTAIINLYLRDFAPLQNLLLQALFYVTPIAYPAEILKAKKYAWIYSCNPLYYMLEIIRKPLLGESTPELRVWIIAVCIAGVLYLAGLVLVIRTGRNVAFEL